MGENIRRGPKVKEKNYEYKHKRAVSLTDKEFEKAKEYFGSTTKAVLFAIDLKEKLK